MNGDNGSNGRAPRFDFSLNFGTLINFAAIVGTGLIALWTMSGDFARQFAKLDGSLERLGQRLELTVQRLDQRDAMHDDRINRLERAYERSRTRALDQP